MLEVDGITAFYGDTQVLRDVTLHVDDGEVLCLLGRNGAGKTTTLKTIMGLVPVGSGTIALDGEDLTAHPPFDVPKRGIGYVPQGRRLFAELTVAENLQIGLMTRRRDHRVQDQVLELFPKLKQRLEQIAGTLSGGEQQMLAMARALCIRPSVLLLDEPTEGLMPSMISTIRQVIAELRHQGVAVLLVEQRVDAVLRIADRVAFLENGQIRDTLSIDALNASPDLLQKYVGI